MTAWLVRVFGPVPSGDTGGLPLEGWEVPGWHIDHGAFFRSLPTLVSEGAVLVLEGGAHVPALRSLLESRAIKPRAMVPIGTAWPRGVVFHLPATPFLMRDLATLAGASASPEVCDHLHVYEGRHLLLQWYDAFVDPFYVSKRVPQDRLEAFCSTLGASFKDVTGAP